MKGMQKISRGAGFYGVLKYAFAGTEARLVGGNMSGFDVSTLSSEFALTRALRQDIKKPVWHSSLRLTKNEKITDEKWSEIAADYMKSMGFSDSHLYCAIMHDDSAGQHIHIVASRISLDKQLFYGRNENLESTRIIHELEQKHNLKITKGLDYVEELDKETGAITYRIATKSEASKRLKKNEIEKALRTNSAPPRLILQNALDEVMSSSKSITVSAFLERLHAANIYVKTSVASTGRLNGFSFSSDGSIWFKGSDIGKLYSLLGLQKRGLTYEQDRDSSAIITATERDVQASDSIRSADSTSDDASSNSNDELERRDSESNSIAQKRDESSDRTSIEETRISAEEIERRHELVIDRDTDSNERAQETDQNIIEDVHAQNNSDDIHQRRDDWRSVADDLTDLAAVTTSDALETRTLTAAQQAKIKSVTKQLDALDAESYRLTLISRTDEAKSFNLGKNSKSSEERFFAKTDVISQIPFLSRKNAQNYDIYITPIDSKHHYIAIDDMTEDSYLSLLNSNFEPCLIQQSSDNNYQAIIKVNKNEISKSEQTAANKLVQNLNQKWGDQNFSGVIHPFRLAGFSNKKKSRKNAFTTVILALNRICSKSVQMLNDIRKSLKSENKRDYKHVEQSETKSLTTKQNQIDTQKVISATSNQVHLAIYEKLLKNAKSFENVDLSVIDYRFCKKLLENHDKQTVIESLISISHDLNNRHKNVYNYANLTVNNAYEELTSERRSSKQRSNRM